MILLQGRDVDLILNHGARVCAKAQRLLRVLVLALTVAAPGGTLLAADAEPVNLGSAANFGALAGAAISGTGQVKGDVGSGSGAIAPAITSTGTIYPTGDAVVMSALTDLTAAYNEGKDRTPDVLLSAAAYELGGTTLTPGVHKIGAAATMGSPVTFNAEGDPDAVFIIQVGGALSATAATGNVVLTNEAHGANIFWIVEGAVSMGANTHMEGSVLGGAAMTFGADTTINGRVLAVAAAGTIALATTVTVPVDPSVVGDRVWFDANINGIQDPAETTGFSNIPVSLLQLVLEKKTIDLGTAAQFGALAGGAISGSGSVAGDVGSGTGAVAPAVTSTGTLYPTGHAVTMAALADFATAYNDGKNRTPDFILSAAAYELGGSTLTPGVYKIGAAATLASPVTLDAGGDAEAVFIIHIVGAFGSTAATGNVILTNNAKSTNVYWIVEGAVSVGAGTDMKGNILGGAAITFGASTTLSGRALAGTAAGTIALATTVSAPTGSPPVGFPPPIVVANTVTDANGNYLFEGVVPGTYMVRWDLTNVTTDYRITAAKQGDDDALDSDSASGEVTGYVYSTEFEVLGGSTNLDVDLGLVETLPAIKTAAKDELATTLISYLLVNYYTAENWTALQTAKTDGDTAIDAATTPAGVAAAKAAALAAMDAVPTVAETLAEAKVTALADLATARATYFQANYTAENWMTLTTANANGEIAIQAATDLAGVATVLHAALVAMDAVPTIAETLAAAKVTALANLAIVLATYLEADYTAEGWIALNTVKLDGDMAIAAATDLAGVAAALDTTVAALDAVPTFAETMATAKAAATIDLTTALATYLEANYYTAENWTALMDARAAGNLAIEAATDPAGVEAARDAALAAMDAVPTYAETLAAAKAAALDDLATALASYLEENYTVENWVVLNTAKINGEIAIAAATDLAGVAAANAAALAAMDAVPTIAETLAAAKAAALDDLAAALAAYLETNYYTAENWVALTTAKTNGDIAINAATDLAGVAAAEDAALAAMEAVPADLSAVSIGSVVWNDLNNNGLQDSGEPGIMGALVSLLVDDGAGNFIPATNLSAAPVSSQTTGSGGIYYFSNLPPGDYRVQVVPPVGFLPSTAQTAAGNDNTENDSNIAGPGAVPGSYLSGIFTLALGALPIESALYTGDALDNAADTSGNMTVDFGFFQLGSITGTVQADTTGDGLGDTPLAGVTLSLLDENGDPVLDGNGDPLTTLTTVDGSYTFDELLPGDYSVVQTLPFGYIAVTPMEVPVTVLSGQPGEANFVDTQPGSITGTILADTTGDGVGDTPLAGVTVSLLDENGDPVLDGNGDPVTTTTDADGAYTFDDLPPGDYFVLQTLPPGYIGATPVAVPVTVLPGQLAEAPFVDTEPGSITGTILADTTGNGIGDTPLANVTVTLLDENGDTVATTTTDINGNYSFLNLPPGVYTVVETVPSGYISLTPISVPITLLPGETEVVNFVDTQPGSISGTVLVDTTGDNLGDTPLVGVTLTLFDANNEPLATTTTNGSGVYSFLDLLPGEYTVVHTLPSGYTAVTPVSVTGSVLIGFETTINFVDDAPTCVIWEQNYADTDGDVFPLIQEYAFGGDPAKGDHLVANTTRRAGLVLTKNLTGGLDVTVVRPAGREDVTYTLVGSADLVLWSELTALPTVTANGDSTDTLTWANVQTFAPMSSERGFVRLKVETSCNPGGSYTLVQGWSEETVAGSRQTHGLNFTSLPVYTSRVDSITGAAVVLQTSATGVDLSSFLVAPDSYYLEFTDGPAEGHRFDIASGDVAALTLNLSSAHNTLETVPTGLDGSHFVIRKHITLADVYPSELYRRSSTVGSADQVQFYNGTGFDTYFSFSAGYWVKQGAGIGNRNYLVIPPGVAAYVVHPNSADSHVILQLGEVRYNDFIRPLPLGSTGLSFVALGFPLDATPYGLDMKVTNGFTASSTVGSADIIQNWIGDTTVNAAGYTTNFLLSGGTWRTQGNITNNTSESFLFKHCRGVFVGIKVNKLDWTHTLPWNPQPWVQPED